MSAELQLFRDNVRRFIQEEVEPHYEQWEKDEIFPREFWNKMGEHGFLAVDLPEEYGGFGVDFHYAMAIQEEFAHANMSSICGSLGIHSDIVAHYILNNGTEEQKQHYLPKLVSGEIVAALAMTEPNAGSDVQGIRTVAKKDGDDYLISGSKIFITNGQHCDLVLVAFKTDLSLLGSQGTSLILVDTSLPGFSRGRNLEKIGMHASDTSELFFDEVRVPQSAVLGQEGAGFRLMMTELPRERLVLAVAGVAAAEGAIDMTAQYVKERTAFGSPIAKLQNTKFKMAEMATDVRIHRSFVNECIDLYSKGELDATTVSMAKYSCTEMQSRVADGCLQLHGGYGYMKEYGISRAYVDSRVQRIYGGTTEIMKELISRSVLK